jgi:HK97 family phage prohead protease
MMKTKAHRRDGRMQFRSLPIELSSFREIQGEDGRVKRSILGVASVTGELYLLYRRDGVEIWEKVHPGTFRKTLLESVNIQVLFGHDSTKVLGSTRAGTARVWEEEDDKGPNGRSGLYFEVEDIGDTTHADDLWKMMKRKEVREASFGYWPIKEEYRDERDKNGRGKIFIDLREADLNETSVCGQGANPLTSSEVRDLIGASRNIGDSEPDGGHSEAGGGSDDDPAASPTSEPAGDDHSEVGEREADVSLDLRRRRLRLRLSLNSK